MKIKDRHKLHIFITAAVMAFIFIHSAMPGSMSSAESNYFVRIIASITGLPEESLKFIVRKSAHFTEYMILGCCLAVNMRDRAITGFKMWLIPWLLSTAYAITDEIHQYFVPGRACALMDMCIDSAGAALGAAIMVIFLNNIMKRRN